MINKLNLSKYRFLAKTIMILAVMLTGGANFVWGDELTINNSTDKGKIPFDAGLCNSGNSIGQVIIPSDSLTALNGKKITKITFYGSSTSDRNFGRFSVYLKEIDYTRFSSTTYESWSGMTSCFSGSLTFSSATKTMEIGLDYIYNEGNLLLGFNQTSSGNYAFHNWYGKSQTGDNYTALYTSNNSGTISGVKFLPKITFTYETPSSTPKPTGFSSSVTAFDSVDLSWTPGGVETQWQIKWNKDSDFDPAEEQGTLVDYSTVTNPYTLSGLSESTTYYAYVRAYIDEVNQSAWTGPVSFTTPEQYPTPTELTASNLAGSGTEATLSWTNGVGTDASKWQLKYSTSSTFNPEEAEVTLVNNVSTNPYTLTGLTANTTYYACVRADYSDNTENHYSDWTDAISFTPIEAWEDFSNGIPETWYNSGFVTNRSGYEGQAFSSSSSNELRTPRLYANKDDQLNFYVTLGGGSITARYYKNSRSSYTTISSYSTGGEKTFTAPSDGYYWIVFTGAYNGAVDNISGFSIADKENLMELGSKTMSLTGTVGGDYTASVVLRELGGSNETYTAQLYYDGEVVAEKVGETINGNRDETVSLTFTPSVAKTSKPMYIKIIYNNGERELTTTSINVTMSETTYVIDEEGDDNPTPLSKVLRVKYHAQNGWNTICMPFALTPEHMNQLFGSGWTAYYIYSFSEGNLSFKKFTGSSLSLSTPYLVYAPNTNEVKDTIYFKSVSIQSGSLGGWESNNRTQTKGNASFIGTFAPIAAPGMEGKYGVTTAGKLGKGSRSASIKGYRAYVEVSDPSSSRLSILIDDDEENQTTDLGFVKLIDKDANNVYNLQGQKVKKATKGIYIVNGRKVIIK